MDSEEFRKQQAEIMFYTVIMCQKQEDIPQAEDWIKQQKEIPYLPKSDIFAYYCPICNNTLNVGCRCSQCEQLIDWKDSMKPKLIGDIFK